METIPGITILREHFQSDGALCHGKLFLPINVSQIGCVIFANGFSGTMDWILPRFATRFSQAGFACFIFDYRHLGESEGHPRQIIDLQKQRIDLLQAVKFVRDHYALKGSKIALWGTSLGGSHVINLASTDPEIEAVIGNMPAIDAFKGANVKAKAKAARASMWQVIASSFGLLAAGLLDVAKGRLGLEPYYIKVFSTKGRAIFTDPALTERFRKVSEGSASWQNKVAARVIFNLPVYREGTIEKIKAPILVTLAEKDIELSNEYLRQMFSKSKSVEIKEYPYDHFSMYHGEGFETVVKDQISFLRKILTG
jgi:uncharacterized protein